MSLMGNQYRRGFPSASGRALHPSPICLWSSSFPNSADKNLANGGAPAHDDERGKSLRRRSAKSIKYAVAAAKRRKEVIAEARNFRVVFLRTLPIQSPLP